jgi:hypothetical protein
MAKNTKKVKARAREWDLGESSTGKEQIAVAFDILTEGFELSGITWYGFFTDDTWERTIESMRHMGWTGTDLEKIEGLNAKEVELVLEEDEYQGKTQWKVAWVNRLGVNLKAPLSPDKRKTLAATMRDRIKGLDAAKGRKPTPTTARTGALPPEPPPLTDADIPF